MIVLNTLFFWILIIFSLIGLLYLLLTCICVVVIFWTLHQIEHSAPQPDFPTLKKRLQKIDHTYR